LKRLRETYARAGIKVEYTGVQIIDPRTLPNIPNNPNYDFSKHGLPTAELKANVYTQEEEKILPCIERNADEVTLVYVNFFSAGGIEMPLTSGQAYIDKCALARFGSGGNYKKYANHAVVAAQNNGKFTVDHEVLHVLLDAAHYEAYSYEDEHPRMLFHRESTIETGFKATKRITGRQVGVITRDDHPFVKDPQQ